MAPSQSPLVAVVSGASSGIGHATARMLAARGYRVFGLSRRMVAPEGVEAIATDIRDDAAVAAAFARIQAVAGGIDVLVANAGRMAYGAVEETVPAEAQAILDTNVLGVLRCVRAALPLMRTRGDGRIVIVGSIAGLLPMPFASIYSASKHALEGFADTLAIEVRPFGIAVSVIQPGYTRTDFDGNGMRPPTALGTYEGPRSRAVAVMKREFAGGQPVEKVAEAVVVAATARSPRRRYRVGRSAVLLPILRSLLPAAAFEAALRRAFEL